MKIEREFNRGSINRPQLRLYWYDERTWIISLSWGNGNSDPVWGIAVCDLHPPAWLRKLMSRVGE